MAPHCTVQVWGRDASTGTVVSIMSVGNRRSPCDLSPDRTLEEMAEIGLAERTLPGSHEPSRRHATRVTAGADGDVDPSR
jgi:hypothetical protein